MYEEKSYDSKPRKAFRRFRFEYTTYISPLLCYFLFHSSQNRRTLSIVNFNLRENRELWIVLEQKYYHSEDQVNLLALNI